MSGNKKETVKIKEKTLKGKENDKEMEIKIRTKGGDAKDANFKELKKFLEEKPYKFSNR